MTKKRENSIRIEGNNLIIPLTVFRGYKYTCEASLGNTAAIGLGTVSFLTTGKLHCLLSEEFHDKAMEADSPLSLDVKRILT